MTGSRSEAFALSCDYVHEEPDLDIMFLYGREWCVRMPGMCTVNEPAQQTYPEMDAEGCASGYCRIYMKGTQKLLRPAKRCSYFPIKIVEFVLFHLAFTISYLAGAFYRNPDVPRKKILLNVITIYISLAFFNKVTAYLIRRIRSPDLYLKYNGKTILLPQTFLRQVSIPFNISTEKFQGPSHTIFDLDLVPALICLQPFPCIEQYLMRERSTKWPTSQTLAQIAATPGVLVPTGKKGSPNYYFEWRFSFSVQEICLAWAMPKWVKAGYRAFKYTLKCYLRALRSSEDSPDHDTVNLNSSLKHQIDNMMSGYVQYLIDLQQNSVSHREKDDVEKETEGSVCSFHFKTILLWSLEDPDTWNDNCPFRLMLRLLRTLEGHLVFGTLPHYFNVECNLFENVSMKDLALTRACVLEIMRDPVAAICHTAVRTGDSMVDAWNWY